jgi:thioredoxin reductase (NADPH)
MSNPVILAVDEDPAVLAAVKEQLADRYSLHYRIEPASDALEAAELVERLVDEGTDVALVIVGYSVVQAMDGPLFDHVRRRLPQAKRALLISRNVWTDRPRADAIRAAMALGRIDHFVVEPGPPPDEVFHEAIGEFLLEWAREQRLVPETVHIVAEEWVGRAYELRAAAEQCAVPHSFCLADSERGRELIAKAGPGAKLPLMILSDGTTLNDPTESEIAAAVGAPTDLDGTTFDLLVVGAGPAGLSAAVYGASEGLRVLVVDAAGIGGQARSSSLIRNYLGFARGISGARLAQQAYDQAALFGAQFLFFRGASRVAATSGGFSLSLADGQSISARSMVLATGASYRRLGIPTLEKLTGAGVFYGGPVAEAPTLTGKDVFIVGGGNSAGQAALHLARHARRVTLIVRAASLETGMSHYLVREVEAAPNVEVHTDTVVSGGGGEARLDHLVLHTLATGEQTIVDADALFVLIGARPLTEWLPAGIAKDAHGFLFTGDDLGDAWRLQRQPWPQETSIPRLFAAGDIRHGSVKRVAAAVGEGATAVRFVHRVLEADLETQQLAS